VEMEARSMRQKEAEKLIEEMETLGLIERSWDAAAKDYVVRLTRKGRLAAAAVQRGEVREWPCGVGF
jgi:DNA-binding MarR family transcriptional regulator